MTNPATGPRTTSALGLLLLLTWSPSARSDTLGVLALAEPPGPDAALVQMNGQLRAALAARIPGVLSAAVLRARMTGEPPLASLAELDRAYTGALAAHATGEYGSSIRTLHAVLESLERLPEGPETLLQWKRAMLRLARSEQELGHGVEAQAILERLMRAVPDLEPDGRQFPPSFLTLLSEVRERLRSQGTHRLRVDSQPPARIFVEGREVGMTPVELDVAPGRYRITGESGGLRAPTILADLSDGDREIRIDLSGAQVLRPDAGPGLALAVSDWPTGVMTAAARLDLDRVVTTTLRRDDEATFLVATLRDVRRGSVQREGRLRLAGGAPLPGGFDALAAFLLTGEPSTLVTTPAGPSFSRPLPPSTAHRHLGFYFHFDLGLGYFRSSASGSADSPIRGGGMELGMSAGTSLAENLVLAGRVWATGPLSPTSSTDNGTTMLVGLGPELTYYFMPSNYFVSVCPSLTRLTRRSGGATIESDYTLGGYLAAGKEWWIGDHWGLGLVAQFVFGVTPERSSGSSLTWTTLAGSLSVSATYH